MKNLVCLVKPFQRKNNGIPDAISAENSLIILFLGRIQSSRQDSHHTSPTARQYSPRKLRTSFRFWRRFTPRKLSFLEPYIVGQKLSTSLATRNPIDIFCQKKKVNLQDPRIFFGSKNIYLPNPLRNDNKHVQSHQGHVTLNMTRLVLFHQQWPGKIDHSVGTS